MITTPEIICDLFSFLDKDQIERIQLVNQFWNNVIIRHKNIWPLREFYELNFYQNRIRLYATEENYNRRFDHFIYEINFDGTNLSKGQLGISNVSSRYSQLNVDEVLTNLNDVVFDYIQIRFCDSEDRLDYLLNLMKLVTAKTGGRFRGRFGQCCAGRIDSKLVEIVDNYIIVDEFVLGITGSYIKEVCANPEIVQLPSTPKEIRLRCVEFKENEKVLHFTCNGKLNGANRLNIELRALDISYGNFIRQWFELYRTHENPISLVGKFELIDDKDIAHDAVKTFLNNTQLRVKYSLETKEFHRSFYETGFINQYLKRSCVLHETDSYALVIEMAYEEVTDMSSINASELDQPPCDKMFMISLCVKSL